MNNFVRILAFILLIGSTIVFILKIKFNIPITHKQLIIFFIVGVISLFWANLRDSKNKE